MSIIAITRGSLLASQKLTDRLASELNWQNVSREQVIEYGKKYGIDEFLAGAQKIMESKPPNSWDPNAQQIHHYLTIFKAALMDYIVQGNIVYHGIQSHFLLSDVPAVLRIKVVAPMDYRNELLAQERNISLSEARDYIIEMDAQRARWSKFLHGIDFDDPTNYDMVLCMSNLNLDAMVDVIKVLINRPEFRLYAANTKIIKDTHLRAQIGAYLTRSSLTRDLDLEIECDAARGLVKIKNKSAAVSGDGWKEDVKEILGIFDKISKLEFVDT